MNLELVKQRLREALAELEQVQPPPPPPPPGTPVDQGTLGVHGQVVVTLPAAIRCNLSQKCRIQVFAMAGGGGSKIAPEMAIDTGPFQVTSRLDKTNSNVPVGAFTLYVKGGVAGVQYAVNAIPE